MARYVIVARVRRAHGVRGDMVVEPLTDSPDVLLAEGRRLFAGTTRGDVIDPPRALQVRSSAPFKDALIMGFEGIDDREAAERWREHYLLVPEAEVEPPAEGEIFLHDLVGLRVEDPHGESLGTVANLFDLPQGVLLEVATPGNTFLVPYRPEFVRHIDRDNRTMTVDLPEGLLD